jgi:hypothetical protein
MPMSTQRRCSAGEPVVGATIWYPLHPLPPAFLSHSLVQFDVHSASPDNNLTPTPDSLQFDLSTPAPAPAPPTYSDYTAPPLPKPYTGTLIEPTRLSLYNFGSRFLPHSKSPIHTLLPIMQDRFLLIGTQDGLSMIDTAPSIIDQNANLVEGINGAIQRDLWKGERCAFIPPEPSPLLT